MQDWNGCKDLKENNVIELTDKRDNHVYNVTKLKDGRCWMAQSLELEQYTLSPADSDVASTYITPQPLADVSTMGGNDYFCDSCSQPKSGYWKQLEGIFYDWRVSTALSWSYQQPEAPYSICPKGWKLPSKTQWSTISDFYSYSMLRQNPMRLDGSDFIGHSSGVGASCYESSTYGTGNDPGNHPSQLHRWIFCSNSSNSYPVGFYNGWSNWTVQIRCTTT